MSVTTTRVITKHLDNMTLYVKVPVEFDIVQEIKRQYTNLEQAAKGYYPKKKLLNNEQFMAKAKPDVISRTQEQADTYARRMSLAYQELINLHHLYFEYIDNLVDKYDA